jgi:hypothetical protein
MSIPIGPLFPIDNGIGRLTLPFCGFMVAPQVEFAPAQRPEEHTTWLVRAAGAVILTAGASVRDSKPKKIALSSSCSLGIAVCRKQGEQRDSSLGYRAVRRSAWS